MDENPFRYNSVVWGGPIWHCLKVTHASKSIRPMECQAKSVLWPDLWCGLCQDLGLVQRQLLPVDQLFDLVR